MQRYVENKGPNTMYVGSSMIPPGEGRMVDVPHEHVEPAPEAGEPSLDDKVADILLGSVAKVAEALPGLTREALDRAALLEKDGANRIGVARAIEAELLTRANASLDDERAAERASLLIAARNKLAAAREALDVEGDTHKHPELQAAVNAAQAEVDVLTAPQD